MKQAQQLAPQPLPAAQWAMETEKRDIGFAELHPGSGYVELHVGDRPRDSDPWDPASNRLRARLDDAGGARVLTSAGPPGLLVCPDGMRLLSAIPDHGPPTAISAGDRLLLCSAAALDGEPIGLVSLLRMSPELVLRMQPQALLSMLLYGHDVGAAAVVWHG